MTDLQHIRGAIVDPRTGVPTSLFYDFLTNLTASTEVAVEDSEFALFNLFGDSTGDSSRNEVEALVNSLYLIPDSTASIEKLHRLVDELKVLLFITPDLTAEVAELSRVAGVQVVEVAAGDTAFTTSGNQIVICNNTSNATVTLNTSPFDGERVHIKRRQAPVTVTGTVDGMSNPALPAQYDAVHLVYTTAAGEWSIL